MSWELIIAFFLSNLGPKGSSEPYRGQKFSQRLPSSLGFSFLVDVLDFIFSGQRGRGPGGRGNSLLNRIEAGGVLFEKVGGRHTGEMIFFRG